MSDAYKDLIAAQKACDPLVKNATNPHFRNTYADLTATLDAALKALHAHNYALVQSVSRNEFGPFLRTSLTHTSGHEILSEVPLLLTKGNMQDLGSAITYARRYSIQSIMGLAAEDDDGNAASGLAQGGSKSSAKISTQPPSKAASNGSTSAPF
tara:strand:- start:243 stop:704 length:462 start_codon:yes stop_codon:yes gene_type:complete